VSRGEARPWELAKRSQTPAKCEARFVPAAIAISAVQDAAKANPGLIIQGARHQSGRGFARV
jgi:hypothetical protein